MEQKDLQVEVHLHKIGQCPICHKGQMLKGTAGWTCDYFQSLKEKCAFTIFKSYQGYDLTEEDALELIEKGETGKRIFHTLSGVPFIAQMKIIDGKVKVIGENHVLQNRCPICGEPVKETQKGYVCENFFKDGDNHCNLYISKNICGHIVTINEAENLLKNKRTEPIDGFINNGKSFTSCLVLQPNGSVLLDGKVCKCPKCGGIVYAGVKAYNCSNYRDPNIRCDFVVWRNMHGRDITTEDVKAVCENRITPMMTFKTKSGDTMQRSLYLNDEFKIQLI